MTDPLSALYSALSADRDNLVRQLADNTDEGRPDYGQLAVMILKVEREIDAVRKMTDQRSAATTLLTAAQNKLPCLGS